MSEKIKLEMIEYNKHDEQYIKIKKNDQCYE